MYVSVSALLVLLWWLNSVTNWLYVITQKWSDCTLKFSIGQLCGHLYEIIGQMIKQYVGVFGLYPGFVTEILNSTKTDHSYRLYSEKLNYEYYIKKKVYLWPKLLYFLQVRLKVFSWIIISRCYNFHYV